MVKLLGSSRVLLLPLFLFANPQFGASAQETQAADAGTLLKRASETIKVRQYDDALELLNSAIEADAGISEAYRQRASVLRKLCRHFQKGLRLDPEHSELKKAYFGLKNLLKKTKIAEDNAAKGKLRVAVEDFKAALMMDPNHSVHNVHLHLGLCKVLVKLGRGKDAVSSCTEALDIDGELDEALVQ